jgi:UDP-glucose 4-epimerase
VRVLVTGGLGFVGRAVTARLIRAGHEVTVLTRQRPPAISDPPTGASIVRGELVDLMEVRGLLLSGEFDAVCHLAARTRVRESFADPLGYWRTNVTGTWNLLAGMRYAAKAHDRPLTLAFASTAAIYLPPKDDKPLRETDPVGPTTPYAGTTLAAEQLIDATIAAEPDRLGAISLRAFAVGGATGRHGDPDLSRIIPKALAVAAGHASRVEINGDGSAARDFVHVADLAEAYLAALTAARAGRHKVVNIGTGVGVQVREVLATVERVTGRRVPVEYRPAAKEQQRLVADTTHTTAVLGWQARRHEIQEIVHDAWGAVSGVTRKEV